MRPFSSAVYRASSQNSFRSLAGRTTREIPLIRIRTTVEKSEIRKFEKSELAWAANDELVNVVDAAFGRIRDIFFL